VVHGHLKEQGEDSHPVGGTAGERVNVRPVRTYYEILGVSPTASVLELKTAYRRLLRQAHPDMGGSATLLDLVNEAYDTLKDPSQRAWYDAAIRQGAKATATGST